MKDELLDSVLDGDAPKSKTVEDMTDAEILAYVHERAKIIATLLSSVGLPPDGVTSAALLELGYGLAEVILKDRKAT